MAVASSSIVDTISPIIITLQTDLKDGKITKASLYEEISSLSKISIKAINIVVASKSIALY